MSAFDFGYRNQNTIKATFGVKIGRDTQEKLTGQYVYGWGAMTFSQALHQQTFLLAALVMT